ncbi:EKI1 kinase, partial [Agelaius phoeniceus]|nr:EKI1 kinase [Agelaius phoeniceus]
MSNYIHVPPGSPEVPKLDITVSEREGPGYRQGALQLLRRLRPHWRPEEVTLQVRGSAGRLARGCGSPGRQGGERQARQGRGRAAIVRGSCRLVSSPLSLPPSPARRRSPLRGAPFAGRPGGGAGRRAASPAASFLPSFHPSLLPLIARQLAKIHTIHAHNGWIPKSNLWLKMGKYFSLIPTEFADEEVNKRFLRDIPSPQVLQEEMAWMKERLSNLGSPVVLCHNDLLCKNIIYNKKRGDVQFIDYEYSGYNYLAYDIGNHFNEFAGVNEVDYSLYPNRKLQEQWLRSYLEAYKEYKGFGTEVSEKEVEVLYVQVNQFALASHFFWGLWALIQAKYSTIDFDFLGYAIVRFNQYFKMKLEVMALTLPE